MMLRAAASKSVHPVVISPSAASAAAAGGAAAAAASAVGATSTASDWSFDYAAVHFSMAGSLSALASGEVALSAAHAHGGGGSGAGGGGGSGSGAAMDVESAPPPPPPSATATAAAAAAAATSTAAGSAAGSAAGTALTAAAKKPARRAPAPRAAHAVRRIIYFAGADNWACVRGLGRRYRNDTFAAVQATADPQTFWNALAGPRINLLMIGTHGANASLLLIAGRAENDTECDVSYVANAAPAAAATAAAAAAAAAAPAIHMDPAEFGRRLNPFLAANARIAVLACAVAGGARGPEFMRDLSRTANATVTAASKGVEMRTTGVAGTVTARVVNAGRMYSSSAGSAAEPTGRGAVYDFDPAPGRMRASIALTAAELAKEKEPEPDHDDSDDGGDGH